MRISDWSSDVCYSDLNAVANTRLVEETKLADGFKRLRFARTENLPSYLIAFAVGPWAIVSWQDIPANVVRTAPLPLRGVAAMGRAEAMRSSLEIGRASCMASVFQYV